MFIDLVREDGRERYRKTEKHQVVASCAHPHPNQGSNPQRFGIPDDAPTTEPTGQGWWSSHLRVLVTCLGTPGHRAVLPSSSTRISRRDLSLGGIPIPEPIPVAQGKQCSDWPVRGWDRAGAALVVGWGCFSIWELATWMGCL